MYVYKHCSLCNLINIVVSRPMCKENLNRNANKIFIFMFINIVEFMLIKIVV